MAVVSLPRAALWALKIKKFGTFLVKNVFVSILGWAITPSARWLHLHLYASPAV